MSSNSNNTSHYETVESTELGNVQIIQKRFPKDLELFRQNFNVLAETISSIADKRKTPDNPHWKRDFVILTTSSKFLQSSKALLNLESNGYDYDARVIMRTMLEDLLRIVCLLRDETMVQKWLEGKLELSEVKCVVHDWFLNREVKRLYDILCDCVHTEPHGLGLLIGTSTEEVRVKLAPLLPDSVEEQAAMLTPPVMFNVILLMILKAAYEKEIEPCTANKISESVSHTLLYFKI